MPHAGCPALGKILFIGLGREVYVRLAVGEGHAQQSFDQVHVIHPDRIVVGEQCTDLDADVAADALLEAILHGLYASARQGVGCEILDALHGAELRTFATGKAEVHVHEGDFAGSFLLFANLVGDIRDAVFLEPTLDDVRLPPCALLLDGMRSVHVTPSGKPPASRPLRIRDSLVVATLERHRHDTPRRSGGGRLLL